MVDQAPVTTRPAASNGSDEFAPRAVARNMADLMHDVTLLAELQSKLFLSDCQAAARRVAIPTVVALTAAVLALCTVPVLLAAIALALDAGLNLPLWAGFLITSGAVLLICGLGLVFAYMKLRTSMKPFERSRHEFSQNVQWIKASLRSKGTRDNPRC